MFHPLSVRNAGGDAGVDFSLNLKGYMQDFRISREALEDHFGSGDWVEIFHANSTKICQVAERKPGVPANGRILLATADF